MQHQIVILKTNIDVLHINIEGEILRHESDRILRNWTLSRIEKIRNRYTKFDGFQDVLDDILTHADYGSGRWGGGGVRG